MFFHARLKRFTMGAHGTQAACTALSVCRRAVQFAVFQFGQAAAAQFGGQRFVFGQMVAHFFHDSAAFGRIGNVVCHQPQRVRTRAVAFGRRALQQAQGFGGGSGFLPLGNLGQNAEHGRRQTEDGQ